MGPHHDTLLPFPIYLIPKMSLQRPARQRRVWGVAHNQASSTLHHAHATAMIVCYKCAFGLDECSISSLFFVHDSPAPAGRQQGRRGLRFIEEVHTEHAPVPCCAQRAMPKCMPSSPPTLFSASNWSSGVCTPPY